MDQGNRLPFKYIIFNNEILCRKIWEIIQMCCLALTTVPCQLIPHITSVTQAFLLLFRNIDLILGFDLCVLAFSDHNIISYGNRLLLT